MFKKSEKKFQTKKIFFCPFFLIFWKLIRMNKKIDILLQETLAGNQQFTNWLTYFWLASVAMCVSVQLIYLNKALDIFNTSMVTPIYYVFFTTFVILASSILYKEWSCLGASDVIGNFVGFLTTIIGIFQVKIFRKIEKKWNFKNFNLKKKFRKKCFSFGKKINFLNFQIF